MSTSEAAKVYFSFNPGVFSCDESWSYRDLQQLCVSLGINAAGKRGALEHRLEEAHREGRQGRVHGAGLFHDEEVNITSSAGEKKISPRLLSPLVRTPSSRSNEESPLALRPGGILRRESSYGENATPNSLRLKPSLRFSPYNKVHVIPPKEESENFGQYREPDIAVIGGAIWDDDEEDDLWINDGL